MAKIKDISSKFNIPTAEIELSLDLGTVEIGQRIGGISTFSNIFKRGYGNDIFGVSEEGMWLGAANFEDAPIRMYFNGVFYLKNESGSLVIDANGITQYDEDNIPVGFWGLKNIF